MMAALLGGSSANAELSSPAKAERDPVLYVAKPLRRRERKEPIGDRGIVAVLDEPAIGIIASVCEQEFGLVLVLRLVHGYIVAAAKGASGRDTRHEAG